MAKNNVMEEARKMIAVILRSRRLELGYSQAHVAKKTGLGVRTIIRAEQAEFWLGMKQFLLICDALHLYPAIAEIKGDTPITDALRQNWKPYPKAISTEES
jgi:transcriptional regulator with XRE-family HTH domain